MPTILKGQPAFSPPPDSGLSAKISAPIRLHTVRIWFHPNGLTLMEDIKRRGLNDVVFDAIALQELGDQHQAQDDHGNTNEAFPVDLAVLEAGILRVRREYGIIKFVPLSSDDPIVLQQSVTDPNSKRSLCYQRVHSKYQGIDGNMTAYGSGAVSAWGASAQTPYGATPYGQSSYGY
ncbi:hypothetical protein N7535_009195 [Penicillium sp. DV-2018c]|nr:hypothetical protein N7461_002904 [Penicillium sp. DV-2018c]KAJ5560998.1 hypothetical protein N7535_009195 [Penicillium sp. DV-2018c]